MISQLECLVDDMSVMQCKLIILIGAPDSGKSLLLSLLGERRQTIPLNIGKELSRSLSVIPYKQRHLEVGNIIRTLANQYANGDLLLIDNIELLFDRKLQLDPLDLLKRHAHARRVIAVWPGDLRDGRLTYADIGHPEHQDYSLDGLVPFEMQ